MPLKQQKSLCLTPWFAKLQMCPYKTSWSWFLCTELKFVQYWLIFCLNLVVMATPLAPLKFYIAYLDSPTPKTLLFMRKIPRFLAHNWNQCNFGLFLPKFGCHGNFLGFLENPGSIFEFTPLAPLKKNFYLNLPTPKTLLKLYFLN